MGTLRRTCATVTRRGPLPKLFWADLLLLLLFSVLRHIVKFLARDALVRTNCRAFAMMFVRLSFCLLFVWPGTGVHGDHTVNFSADLSLWLHSPYVLGTLTPKHLHLAALGSLFPVPPGSEDGCAGRNRCQLGHSTMVSIRVPETVLRVRRTEQWAWLD